MNTISRLLTQLRGSPQTADQSIRATGQYVSPVTEQPISVSDLALHLANQTDAPSLLREGAEWLRIRAALDPVIIYLHEPAANRLAQPITVGTPLPDLPETIRLGFTIPGEVAVNRKAYFVESIRLERRLNPVPNGAVSAYITPLIHNATLLGVAMMFTNRAAALSEPARTAIDRVLTLVSALLYTNFQLMNTQQAINRFARMQSLAGDLVERLSSQALLQRITDAAREMLDTTMSVLLEGNQFDGVLRPVAWSGIADDAAKMIQVRLREDLKGLVAWARQPARSPDLRVDQRTTLSRDSFVAGMVSELAVPVVYRDELYGVLAVETETHRHFTDEEMTLLESLAAHAGIALRNAQLFETLTERNKQLEKANADLVISRQQAENARAAAVQANRLKTEFINNMSHELRTPLNAVINFTRLVSEGHAGPVNDQQKQFLSYVSEGGSHLLGLINDILDMAKIEAGKMELRREPTPLEPIIKGVMSTLVGLTRDKQITLNSEVDPDLPDLFIDGRRIRQVLLNLVSNAAKFTHEGSITIAVARQGSFVIVSVRDTGVGIRPEDLPKVFEEFKQVDNPLQENASGTGLGMPISKRFVQLHGGDMWIESQINVGTTVSFSLPL